MSMNLHCNNVDLWQTPTYITWMCMAEKDGYSMEFKGVKAKRALQAYIQWVMGINGSFCGNEEEYQIHLADIKADREHCDSVRKAIESKGLVVYVM